MILSFHRPLDVLARRRWRGQNTFINTFHPRDQQHLFDSGISDQNIRNLFTGENVRTRDLRQVT